MHTCVYVHELSNAFDSVPVGNTEKLLLDTLFNCYLIFPMCKLPCTRICTTSISTKAIFRPPCCWKMLKVSLITCNAFELFSLQPPLSMLHSVIFEQKKPNSGCYGRFHCSVVCPYLTAGCVNNLFVKPGSLQAVESVWKKYTYKKVSSHSAACDGYYPCPSLNRKYMDALHRATKILQRTWAYTKT